MLKGEKVVVRALEKSDMDRLHEFANDYELYLMADDVSCAPTGSPRRRSLTA